MQGRLWAKKQTWRGVGRPGGLWTEPLWVMGVASKCYFCLLSCSTIEPGVVCKDGRMEGVTGAECNPGACPVSLALCPVFQPSLRSDVSLDVDVDAPVMLVTNPDAQLLSVSWALDCPRLPLGPHG